MDNNKHVPEMITNNDVNLYFFRDSLRISVVFLSVWVFFGCHRHI